MRSLIRFSLGTFWLCKVSSSWQRSVKSDRGFESSLSEHVMKYVFLCCGYSYTLCLDFWCLGRAVLRDCGIFWVSSLIFYNLNVKMRNNMSRGTVFPTRLHEHPAKTQISLRIRAVWSESTLPVCRGFRSLTTHRVPCEDSDQTVRMRKKLIFSRDTIERSVVQKCSFWQWWNVNWWTDEQDELINRMNWWTGWDEPCYAKMVHSNMLKMCRFRSSCACAKYHPGLHSLIIHSVVSSDSVSGLWRPWTDCANAQADLGLRCPHVPEDKFSHGAA